MFFEDLATFGSAPALLDVRTGAVTDYATLETLVRARMEGLPKTRSLAFIDTRHDLRTVVDYLACLRLRHAVHLVDDLSGDKAKALAARYAPDLLLHGDGRVEESGKPPARLNPELALLLSTSGSTGAPKLVKLSRRNIQSNAEAIGEYLGLSADERAFLFLPLHYSFGLSVLNSHLAAGACTILFDGAITDADFLPALKSTGATSFSGVPYVFEALAKDGFDSSTYPALRYAAQAGGRLSPELVRRFARDFRRFFVMYGQTEAAPRMAYLPPELAASRPEAIGRAIPGGELFLLDAEGARVMKPDVEGELCYRGPNVMMGYAETTNDLSADETPEFLRTGDIAVIGADGLFSITGRAGRFVKPYGLRISLDQIEADLAAAGYTAAAAGDDTRILVAFEGKADVSACARLAARYGIPAELFSAASLAQLPRLPSGKTDYRALADLAAPRPSLLRRVLGRVRDALELEEKTWDSIQDLYGTILLAPGVGPADTFRTVGADSLSFVRLSLALETALGPELPADWQDRTVGELEEIYRRRRVG